MRKKSPKRQTPEPEPDPAPAKPKAVAVTINKQQTLPPDAARRRRDYLKDSVEIERQWSRINF
jgi:hypothetical protein